MLAGADLADAGNSFGFSGGFNTYLGNYSTGCRPLGLSRQFETCIHWIEFRIVGLGGGVIRLIVVEIFVAFALTSGDTSLGIIVGTKGDGQKKVSAVSGQKKVSGTVY